MKTWLIETIVVAVTAMVIIGLFLGFQREIKIVGQQAEQIKTRDAALREVEKARQDAEAAVADRDRKLTQINLDNRRLHDEIKKATQGSDCADQPIPPDLDRLLRERTAARPGPNLPAVHP